ncbi:gap junction alpha-10 protein [Corchorus olitorius]|uniref:Gap junction alpha-10 protein n=1 Tax=Corchorus olitorius TaxID=93759 RepID=A0A1R3KZL3_9ROSI|nr:gap junction alpha-10 protein [Corchorus olitorius]
MGLSPKKGSEVTRLIKERKYLDSDSSSNANRNGFSFSQG